MKQGSFLLCLGWLLVVGCSSQQLVIESSPQGAEIYAVGKEPVLLGKTPLTISSDEFMAKVNSTATQLELRLDSYQKSYILVSDWAAKELRINVEMIKVNQEESIEATNELVESLFDIQYKIRMGQLQDANQLIQDLKKKKPFIAALHELEGSIYVIQKQWLNAHKSFEAAMAYNPKSEYSRQALTQLSQFVENKVERIPASAAAPTKNPTEAKTEETNKESNESPPTKESEQ